MISARLGTDKFSTLAAPLAPIFPADERVSKPVVVKPVVAPSSKIVPPVMIDTFRLPALTGVTVPMVTLPAERFPMVMVPERAVPVFAINPISALDTEKAPVPDPIPIVRPVVPLRDG